MKRFNIGPYRIRFGKDSLETPIDRIVNNSMVIYRCYIRFPLLFVRVGRVWMKIYRGR